MRLFFVLLILAPLFACVDGDSTTDPSSSSPVAGSTEGPVSSSSARSSSESGSTTAGSTAAPEASTASIASPPTTASSESEAPTEKPDTTTPGPSDAPTASQSSTKAPSTAEPASTSTVPPTRITVAPSTHAPQYLDFAPTCDEDICTYSMKVPGLDEETYNSLLQKINNDNETVVELDQSELALENSVRNELDDVDTQISGLQKRADALNKEIDSLNDILSVLSGNNKSISINLIIAQNSLDNITSKRSSCLYKQCILYPPATTPTTTPKPTTTRFEYCASTPCKNNGNCTLWYSSYKCTCSGNLDAAQDCATSACAVVNQPSTPGLVLSPGYDGKNNDATSCKQAQWTIVGSGGSGKILQIDNTTGAYDVYNLGSSLKVTVGKYSLTVADNNLGKVNTVLAKGDNVTITYVPFSKSTYFKFTVFETDSSTSSSWFLSHLSPFE